MRHPTINPIELEVKNYKIMIRSLFNTFLREFESLQIFALCKDFDDLTLEDVASTSISTSTSLNRIPDADDLYREGSLASSYAERLRASISSPIRAVTDSLRVPFAGVPEDFIDSSFFSKNLSSVARGLSMALGFRFTPGQASYLYNELNLPESYDRLSFLCNSLGLFYAPMHSGALASFSRDNAGLLGENYELNRVLVEVVTSSDGLFGRFFVLVCLGVGCTVWYAKVRNPSPLEGPFSYLESYDEFFNMDFIPSFYPFQKLTFLETRNISAVVESTFGNEQPFVEISIPASGPVLKAVGLGVMVAFFLAVGIVPNVSSSIKE